MTKRVLLIEFNELCPSLLDKWIAEGKLPNFERFYKQSDVYVTEADAEPPHLNPWTQWFSVHSGKSFDTHQVKRLTDGPLSKEKDIWTFLAEQGMSVGNFSSMNCKSFDYKDSFYFPDPWTQTEKPFPQQLSKLNDFVSSNVQEHTRVGASKANLAMEFLGFYLKNGFNFKTVFNILGQLIKERKEKKQQWRRAFVLDWLGFDVFSSLIKKQTPDFATFFSNSTAHMQHGYWRHHDPDAFEVKPSQSEIDIYGSAIFEAYRNQDYLLGEFFKLEEKFGYKLVLLSALSQQPFTKYEKSGGQQFYRLLDVEKFIGSLGFTPSEVLPTMTHQFRARFNDDSQAAEIKEKLQEIKAPDGSPLFYCHLDNPKEVYFACAQTSELDLSATVNINGKDVVLSSLLNKIDGSKSGCHHPDGIAWFKWGAPKVHENKISLTDVAPTISDYFGVKKEHGFEGKSVLTDLEHAS